MIELSQQQKSNMVDANFYELGNSLSKHVQALIGLVGIITNTLAIFVFEQKKLKKHSYSIYWKLKACSDSLLLLHTFRHWARYFLNVDIDLISPLFCRFNEYQPYVAANISLWLETLITFDRFVTIVNPNRLQLVKHRPFQIATISLIVLYSFLLPINLPLNFRLIEVNGTLICDVPRRVLGLNWLLSLFNIIFVNIFINPILDIKIVYHIVSSRGNVRRLNRSAIIDRQFTLSAIGVNIVSLVSKLPFVIGNLISVYYLSLSSEQTEMLFTICLSVFMIEKIDVFFINVIVNSIFRREFLSMIGCDSKSDMEVSYALNSSPSVNLRRRNKPEIVAESQSLCGTN